MKKNVLNWMIFMMVAIVSVTLISCSSDDNNDESYSIIGRWESRHGNAYSQITFYEDGKGHDITYDSGKVDYEGNFTYVFDSKTMRIIVYEEGETFELKVISLTAQTLIIEVTEFGKVSDKEILTLTRL